jgi:hypothetical protein
MQANHGFREPVFFVTPLDGLSPVVIDVVIVKGDGTAIGMYSRETLDQLALKHPSVVMGEMDDVIALKEAIHKTAPVEIAEEDFLFALEELPPDGWQTADQWESFKASEHLSGRITAIYARCGARHFCFNDLCTLTHIAIKAKVEQMFPETRLCR